MIIRKLIVLLALSGFTTLQVNAMPPGAPDHLRVNDVVSPVGTGASVFFGWHVNDPDPNEMQTRWQILVASSESKLSANIGDLWDSGEMAGGLQNHVPFTGSSLQSDRRCFWKVRTWDKDGNAGPYSAPSSFVVGLLANPDWAGASWIRRDTNEKDDYTYYRKKTALLAKPIQRATVYVSGTHKYALYLNGQLVGKGPAYHQPQYQYYNAFDITPLLKVGAQNQFALFNHWFGGGQGRPVGARGVIMKAILHHTDGTLTEIGTDGTWLQSPAMAWVPGQPERNRGEGVGFVECIDARKLEPDWTTPAFNDSAWSAATVIGQPPTAPWTGVLAADLTRIEENPITPVSIEQKGPGKYVVDLGKVYAGLPRIRFSGGKDGETVTMRGGYTLNSSGEIPKDAKSQATLMEYRAVLSGAAFVYEPVEYLGMRYFQIDNAPMPVTADTFAFMARHTHLDANASSFESSDATLNAVWDLMKHSLFACAQEEFVDTPTREKGGFLGDSVIQSTVAMPVLAERALTRRTLGEFLQSMDQYWSKPADRGRINAVYPTRDSGRDIPDFTQAYLTWVWNYYMETGDRAFLTENYVKLKDVADYVHRHTDPATGLVTNLTGGSGAYKNGIIDWPISMRFDYDMSTTARAVVNDWAYADYDIMARIAGTVGNTADRENYRACADTLKTAINTHLFAGSGVYIDGLSAAGKPSSHVSQHANIFPLALGMVPSERAATVVAKVKELKMSVGMVTVSWLVRALGQADEGPHLIDLYTNKEWLGWARSISRGATTTWEDWNSDVSEGQSLSHAWGAAGLEGYYRYILGIRPLKPQYEEVRIQPLDFPGKIDWVKGKITTDRGEITVHWKRAAGSFALRVQLPVNVTAQIALPKGQAAKPVVLLDGASVPASIEGSYLVVSGVGSGEHTLIRQDVPAR